MSFSKLASVVTIALALSACATTTTAHDPNRDLGILWVKYSAEYEALAAQAYREASDDLPDLIADKTWNAMSGHGNPPSDLPPAVILDVDETVVSNVDFQLTFERPFANHKLDTWSSNYQSRAIPGVRSFVEKARALDVTVFFVTNRPCEVKAGNDDPCPQQQTTIEDIQEVGISADADHVLLSGEESGWEREKLVRRNVIAKTHRIIMLIGDDFGDFAPCVRAEPHAPCTEHATRASRAEALEKYRDFWGNGWYILPNPMHGSWTSVQ